MSVLSSSLLLGVLLAAPASPVDADRLVKQLGDRDFAVREQASLSLAAMDASLLPKLTEAARSPQAETAMRAIAILEAWAQPPDVESDPDAADPRAAEAERALVELAAGENRQSAMLARLAIARFADARQKHAVAMIRQLGGVVEYDRGLLNRRMPAAIPGGFMPNRALLLRSASGEQQITRIKLGDTWTGGDAGLYHLRRLEHADGFKIRVEGMPEGLTPTAVRALKGVLDVEIDFASTATLGISAETSTPLRISQVVEGGACSRAGLRGGDIVRELDGREVRSLGHVKVLLRAYEPGITVPLVYERGGRLETVDVTLDDWAKNDATGR